MSAYRFALADRADDCALRRRMAEDVLNGRIAVTFRREPSYFAGTALQGADAEVIKCVERESGRIVGLATRATLPAYVNGCEREFGYLCDLRVDTTARGGTLLARGYRLLKQLHDAAPVDLYYTMILSDNVAALEVLTSGRASLPTYSPFGTVLSPALHLGRRRRYRFSDSLRIVKASERTIDAAFAFVNAQYRRHQFAPVYRPGDPGRARLNGLAQQDIYLALKNGKIAGCVACWDQGHVRQIYVERYNAALRMLRPVYNAVAPLAARKPLPRRGERIPCFYLALTAIENDDPDIFRELLEHIYAERRRGPWHFFVAGLHEDSPLAPTLDAFPGIAASGQLFIVHWPDGRQAFDALDGRVPHIEVGAL